MSNWRESKFLEANRSIPWLGDRSVREYAYLRSTLTPETISGYELSPEEEFCLWLWEDARNLCAEFDVSPQDMPIEDIYEKYFDLNFLRTFSSIESAEPLDGNPQPNRLRLRILANKVLFRDKVKSTFPMHLAGALGLVALGFAIQDPNMELSHYNEVTDEYIQGKKRNEIRGFFTSLDEPLCSQFLTAERIFRKKRRGMNLDREEKMFIQQVEQRYGSLQRYMRNLLLAGNYIERARSKLNSPIEPE